jgi:iron(III) transport system ATP-binding protein
LRAFLKGELRMKQALQVKNLTKRFKEFVAVDDVSFEVEEGEFLTLLGPSGCGKTTTLRMICGLEQVDCGEIVIGGELVSSSNVFVPPEKRGVGMVFQSYALWPHKSVYENVAYGLRLSKVPKKEINKRVDRTLSLIGMELHKKRYPAELSGGQQQRVAVARALVLEPRLLLFDEPLSNLDAKLRVQLRDELKDLQTKLSMTSVYVTHDQSEAMALSDRIIVMDSGRIVQIGKPREIYEKPADVSIASFIGTVNIIEGKIIREGHTVKILSNSGFEIPVGEEHLKELSVLEGKDLIVTIRPQYIDLSLDAREIPGWLIMSVMYMGENVRYIVKFGEVELLILDTKFQDVEKGSTVNLSIDPRGVNIFPKNHGDT